MLQVTNLRTSKSQSRRFQGVAVSIYGKLGHFTIRRPYFSNRKMVSVKTETGLCVLKLFTAKITCSSLREPISSINKAKQMFIGSIILNF